MENYKTSKVGMETARKYADIIDMERPQNEESLRKHPRMTLQNRAKIFSPFAALRGYDDQLAEEKQRSERVTKKILTEEEMADLSDKLMQVTKGMTITIQYFNEDTPALFSALAMERFISPMPSTALSARFVQTIIRKKNPRRRKKIVTRFFCQSLAAISCGTHSALASARTKPT